jgi:hypothetical protein
MNNEYFFSTDFYNEEISDDEIKSFLDAQDTLDAMENKIDNVVKKVLNFFLEAIHRNHYINNIYEITSIDHCFIWIEFNSDPDDRVRMPIKFLTKKGRKEFIKEFREKEIEDKKRREKEKKKARHALYLKLKAEEKKQLKEFEND